MSSRRTMLSANLVASPPIPYVRSMAAQPKVTSFIDLPAELRNEIYVLALVVPDPLTIISGRVYRHLGDGNHTLTTIGEPCSPKERDPDLSDIIRVVLPGHGVIRTSRQVYHEATSVFFAQNVFVMSRPICDTMETCFPGHSADPHGAFLSASANWLTAIGSSLPKLQKIIVDVHAFCNTWSLADVNGYHLEVLALLRVLWNQDWLGKVVFQSASKLASERRLCNCRDTYASGSRPIDAENLNLLFASLLRDDLGIRKYRQTLRHVAIQRNKPYGVVAFRSNNQTQCRQDSGHTYLSKKEILCLKHCGTFELHNDHRTRMVKQEASFLTLPVALLQRIIDFVLFHDGPINVFAQKSGTYKTPGILYAKRSILWDEYKHYFETNEFIIHINMHTSSLSDLEPLTEWRKRRYTSLRRLPWGVPADINCYKERNIKSLCLNYKPDNGEHITFGLIRINVAAITRNGESIGCNRASVSIRVRILHNMGNGNDARLQENIFDLHRARLRALDALRKLRAAIYSIRNDNDVGIVINGYGDPVGFVYYDKMDVHPLP